MATNVFVASTPLQLISCTEAKAHYRCPDSSCLLIVARPDNKVTASQMAFLIDQLGWSGIETVHLNKRTFYLRLNSLFSRLADQGIDGLFIGNQSSWIHEAFYLGLFWKQLVFVDDGLATVKYYNAIHSEGLVSRITEDKRRLLKRLGVHLHRATPERVEFFTCFPLESCSKVAVETHNFPLFRQMLQSRVVEKAGEPLVGFLGQPLGGDRRLWLIQSQIKHVIKRHPGAQIVYFMHRKERRRELERALSCFPVELRSPGLPIEIEVAVSGEPYVGFYSFVSTALFTLKKLFPEVSVFQIDDPTLAEKLPFYDDVLVLFDRVGVEITQL